MKPQPPSGTKRLCANCAARFYDLGKQPAICPKCNTAQSKPVDIVS